MANKTSFDMIAIDKEQFVKQIHDSGLSIRKLGLMPEVNRTERQIRRYLNSGFIPKRLYEIITAKIGKTAEKDYIREMRKAQGYTQKDISEKAGINIQSYKAFENGKQSLMQSPFSLTLKILIALNIDVEHFYKMYNYEKG